MTASRSSIFTSDTFNCQVGHTTPETSRNGITNCPGTTASGHCQMSTKFFAEGDTVTGETESEYFGFRFYAEDHQAENTHTVCGCKAISDDIDDIYVELEITGTATPAPNRNDYDVTEHDYVVWYRNGPNTIESLAVEGTSVPYTVVVTVSKGDVDVPSCLEDYVPNGFGIYIVTEGDDNDDHDPAIELETAIFRVTRMWHGNRNPGLGTQISNPVGWNNIARFVIEDGAPN